MDRLLSFLTVQHDIKLVLLSLCAATATAFVTFTVYSHLLARSGRRDSGWLLLAGSCAGVGMWAAHVIMALAVTAQVRSYSPLFGVLSLAMALASAMGGITVSMRPGRVAAATGGAIIGAGIALTHLVGIAGFTFADGAQWSLVMGALSLLLGTALSVAAMLAFRELLGQQALAAATSLLASSIVVALLTGSAALSVTSDAAAAGKSVDTSIFVLAAVAVAALMLLAGYLTARLDGRAMRSMYSRLDELVDVLVEGLVIADKGKIISVNARVLEWTGYRQRDLVGKRVYGDLFGTNRRHALPGETIKFDTSLHALTGSTVPVHVVRRPLHALAHASEVYAIRDMREQVEAAERIANLADELKECQQDLRRRKSFLEGLVNTMPDGVCLLDVDHRVVVNNTQYATVYGLAPDEIKTRMPLREIVHKHIAEGLYAGASAEERFTQIAKAGETIQELSDGRKILIDRKPLPGLGWVTTHKDITDRRHLEEETRHRSQNDPVTDLPNRQSIYKLLEEALAKGVRGKRRFAVLMLDLHNFQEINGSLGHAMGDSLLKAVAERLREHTRKTTIIGRFGDDEFALIEVIDQPAWDVPALVGRLQEQLRLPFKLNGQTIAVDCAMGGAVSPADGEDAATLLKSANIALHQAKAQARGSHSMFEPSMDSALKERLALERDLAEAVAKGEFTLYYQPLFSIAQNEVSGFEALLRWQHPTRGLVSPATFLPTAEASGLMPAIEAWTLRHACAEAAKWPGALKVSINISADRFRSPDFAQSVLRALAATGLNAERLEIEISEKVIQADPEKALTTLRQLADLGVRIALDDFGTGFASLNFLRQFPIHRVKVDRTFVKNLTQQSDSQIILRTLSRLGTGFGVATTAEGVETKEQFEPVRAEGYTEMQGYYFSPPRSAEEIRTLFLQKSKSAVA